VSVRRFFDFYEEFQQNKNQLELDVFDYFREIRFQIDEHRERLKQQIDDISLEMINEAKKHEETFKKNLKDVFERSSFDDSKSLEDALTHIEETYRDPNLLIQTIQDMQQKQKESLKDIQFKLNQMTKIKEDLKASNQFKPNLIPFNQNKTSCFGLIKLNGYWLNTNSLKSEILTGEQQYLQLLKLCEFSPNDKWSLLYRATRDGFGSNDFHSRCDGRANTLTISKAKQSEFIFGGFTSVRWESYTRGGYKSDANAFLYSFTNGDKKPLKIKVDPNEQAFAIRCDSRCGPSFGWDLIIANNANTTTNSYSNLGFPYKHPQYAEGTNEAKTFLAGSQSFQLDEIEVYQKE
jgi:hypothetical protein